jgi:hypothetical protein
MSIVVELWDFIRARRKFWIVPMLMMLFVLGGLMVAVQGSAIAPFIYTLF